MSKTIVLGWGACTPMRPDHVLTQLRPYGVNVENLTVDGQLTGSEAHVTVSDAAAKWAEYLLLRSGKFGLYSPPLDKRNIKWAARWQMMPAQRGCSNHTQAGTVGKMPTPWSESKGKRQPRQRRNKRSRQHGGILDTLARLFR